MHRLCSFSSKARQCWNNRDSKTVCLGERCCLWMVSYFIVKLLSQSHLTGWCDGRKKLTEKGKHVGWFSVHKSRFVVLARSCDQVKALKHINKCQLFDYMKRLAKLTVKWRIKVQTVTLYYYTWKFMKRFSSGCLTVESLRSKSDSPFLSTGSCLVVARIERTTSTLSNVEKKNCI